MANPPVAPDDPRNWSLVFNSWLFPPFPAEHEPITWEKWLARDARWEYVFRLYPTFYTPNVGHNPSYDIATSTCYDTDRAIFLLDTTGAPANLVLHASAGWYGDTTFSRGTMQLFYLEIEMPPVRDGWPGYVIPQFQFWYLDQPRPTPDWWSQGLIPASRPFGGPFVGQQPVSIPLINTERVVRDGWTLFLVREITEAVEVYWTVDPDNYPYVSWPDAQGIHKWDYYTQISIGAWTEGGLQLVPLVPGDPSGRPGTRGVGIRG